MKSDYVDRVLAIEWASLKSAYGSAADVGPWLVELTSTDWEKAFHASHMLWCSLCHQHAFISPAAEQAFPFLVEIAKRADERLLVELLDILCGFALRSEPLGDGIPVAGEWVRSIRAGLVKEIPWFKSLQTSTNSDVISFVSSILATLDA